MTKKKSAQVIEIEAQIKAAEKVGDLRLLNLLMRKRRSILGAEAKHKNSSLNLALRNKQIQERYQSETKSGDMFAKQPYEVIRELSEGYSLTKRHVRNVVAQRKSA
jgi:hypothetical protein